MNAKLDAIICAIEAADNRMIGLELQTDEAAKAIRDQVIAVVDAAPARAPTLKPA